MEKKTAADITKESVEEDRNKAQAAFSGEMHLHQEGGYIRQVIFGFNDGLITAFGLFMGLIGTIESGGIIIFVILASAVAGAASMGLGEYISTKSQKEFYESEIEREKQEIKDMPEAEKEEIRVLYREKGFEGETLETIVETITSDEKIWLKVMLQEELGLYSDKFENPFKVGAIMSIAFIIGSIIPLIPIFTLGYSMELMYITAAVSLAGLFIVGAAKTKITQKYWLKSGIEMVIIGIIASAVAFYAGKLISTLVPGLIV